MLSMGMNRHYISYMLSHVMSTHAIWFLCSGCTNYMLKVYMLYIYIICIMSYYDKVGYLNTWINTHAMLVILHRIDWGLEIKVIFLAVGNDTENSLFKYDHWLIVVYWVFSSEEVLSATIT